jgi:ABC-type multidrug transport system fused ATPase/permease subunit
LITLTIPFEIAVEPGLGKMLYEKIFVTLDVYLLYKYLGIQTILLGFGCIFTLLFTLHQTKITISISNAIKEKMLMNLFHAKMGFYYIYDTGFLIKRIVEDSQAIAVGISSIITIFCNVLIITCIGTVLYIIKDWICYVYCVLLAISILWIPIWLKPIYIYNLKIGELYSNMYSQYWEILPGIKEIKTNNLYHSVNKKMCELSKNLKRDNIIITILYALMHQLSFFFPMAGYTAFLIIGLVKIENGEFTIGLLLGLFSILWGIYQPVQTIFGSIDSVQSGMTAVKRIAVLKNATQEKTGKKRFVEFKDSIEFKSVTFSYNGKNNVVENIDLAIYKGRKVALVGTTGSGKSTLINLLLNLFDDYSGEISIDGVRLHDYSIKSLRDKIVLITQDVHIFKDTIRNNIDMRSQLTDDEIVDILLKVNLHELVASLPKGIDTKIGEEGVNLSGGEKQRISIARCFAAHPQIVVLDEITSSLDPENERRLIAEIENYAVDKTLISISHKLSTIKNYDEIHVIKKGRIVEKGTHDELLRKNSEYCSLFNLA